MDGTTATIGMTQDGALRTGTVCSVTLPRVGDRIEANQIIGEIESSRTTKQIIAISGRVINVNTGIEADPKLINYPEPSSEGGGWLIKVDVSGASVEGLMDSREYFFSSLTSAFTAYEEMFPRR